MDTIEKKIYDGMLEKLDIDESLLEDFTVDTLIFGGAPEGGTSLELDSIDSLELVVLIYDEWGIDVPAEDMPQLSTIRNIAEYVRKHGGV